MTDPLDPTPGAPAPAGPWRPTPTATPKRAGKGGGAWLGLVFGVLLVGSCLVMGVVVLGGAAGGGSGGVVTEQVSGAGRDRIAVIPVEGMITRGMAGAGPFVPGIADTVARVREYLARAKDDERVRAVILEINSPGGEVTACDLIHDALVEFRRESKKPLVAYLEGAAASGGYYIAAPCDRIVCHRTTITGSIGVRMSYLNFGELAAKHGVREISITSGQHKDMGSMWQELDDAERQILQGLVDEMYARFLEVVATGRRLDPGVVRPLADGRILTAQQALDGKLVDALGDLDAAVDAAKQLAGVAEASVVRYTRQPSLFDLLNARAAAAAPTASPAGIVAELERLATPRLLFHAAR